MKYLILLLLPFLAFGQGKATHGSSLYFDGVNDTIFVADNSSIDFSTVYTVEVWYKPVSWNLSGDEIVSKNNAYYLNITNVGRIFQVYNYGITPPGYLQSKTVVALNKWQHFAVTFLNTDSIKFYYNGIRDTVYKITSGSITNSDKPLTIGGLNGSAKCSNCYIKQVRYYKRALSASEVNWNYNHPEKIYSTDSMKLFFPMSEFTGTTLTDSSGNSNTGTITGATWSFDTPVKSGGN